MKIIFLDIDGVVNTIFWDEEKQKFRFSNPMDNKVSNTTAVNILTGICRETNAKIVISSSWRKITDVSECLYNSGLPRDIEIIGKTGSRNDGCRGKEITDWLKDNENLGIENYVVIDDEVNNITPYHLGKVIQTDSDSGLTAKSGFRVINILKGY